jgi:hypothetical protein
MPFEPRPADMWQRWRFAPTVNDKPELVDEDPWWVRHSVPVPNTVFKLKDIAALDEATGLWKVQ